ncbi:SEL1-like repeat protein [Brevundimonas sp.]|uniref:SEL1-like repeat protein n=1 Tax=Brevundimonas sp. TaxID=1871086 RepID=UPI003D0FAD71
MSAAAPWSVKGIDPKAREVAKDLARRSGMTLGEWLNSMIMEDEEEGYATLPRRSQASEYERRNRSRRLDDAYDVAEDNGHRISASIDVIAARLEAAERRSTVAIQGVDQAVSGLMRRLDGQYVEAQGAARRIDDIAEELREGHRRLRAFERDTGPLTQEAFGKVEASLGALTGRLYDIEERQRLGVNDLRERMEAVEKAAGPGVGTEMLAQVGARLDEAQNRTTEALKTLERSFAELDQRMRSAESRVEPESARDLARFEKLAESLSRQIENNRAEMMQRLDAAETGARIDRIERAVQAVGDQIKTSEQKGAVGLEAMGREVLRIARNLNARVQKVETDSDGRTDAVARAVTEAVGQTIETEVARRAGRLDQEFARHVDRVDQRLTASDDRHAIALEKLGGEITRISDQLSDRIAQSERRSQQALEDIGRRLSESSDKIEQRYDRASGELAERMRMSEERTARLLAEARDSIDARGPTPIRDKPLDSEPSWTPSRPVLERAAPATIQAPIQSTSVDGDWRAAAFPDETFTDQDAWSSDPVTPEVAAASPFPSTNFAEPEADTVTADADETPARQVDPDGVEPIIQPFSGFGGADVEDALEATSPGFSTEKRDAPVLDADDDDDFGGETEFVDPRQLRATMGAAAAAGRASATRSTIDAARAAITTPPEPEPAPRSGFGLKRGGKSKLQERLDKQAAKDGSTVKKTFLASVTAVALTGGVYGYLSLTDGGAPDFDLPSFGGAPAAGPAMPLAASAVTPTGVRPTFDLAGPGAADYETAIGKLEAGDSTGLDGMKRAANLGYAPAQTYLGQLYLDGANGVPADPALSRQWGRRAAEGGDPRGMHLYGMQLYEGDGGATNQAEALTWLLNAAERGLPDSQYNVARIYETGADGVAKNPTEALKWYMIAARGGDSEAQTAVTRLRPTASATAQRAARTAADAFVAQTQPASQATG